MSAFQFWPIIAGNSVTQMSNALKGYIQHMPVHCEPNRTGKMVKIWSELKPFKLHFVEDGGDVDVSHHVHALDELLQVLELAEGESDRAPHRRSLVQPQAVEGVKSSHRHVLFRLNIMHNTGIRLYESSSRNHHWFA